MLQIFANIFSPWGEMKLEMFVLPRVESQVWHQLFSAQVEIENFTPGWNSTCVDALNLFIFLIELKNVH